MHSSCPWAKDLLAISISSCRQRIQNFLKNSKLKIIEGSFKMSGVVKMNYYTEMEGLHDFNCWSLEATFSNLTISVQGRQCLTTKMITKRNFYMVNLFKKNVAVTVAMTFYKSWTSSLKWTDHKRSHLLWWNFPKNLGSYNLTLLAIAYLWPEHTVVVN